MYVNTCRHIERYSCVCSALIPGCFDDEHLGPELVDESGGLYNDVYAPGCLNEWSWKYDPEQDPFGSIYD